MEEEKKPILPPRPIKREESNSTPSFIPPPRPPVITAEASNQHNEFGQTNTDIDKPVTDLQTPKQMTEFENQKTNIQQEKQALLEKISIKEEKEKQEEKENKKNTLKKIWKWITKIFDWLLIPICAFALFFAGSLLITKKTKGVPMIFNYSMVRISSGSMTDATENGGFKIGDYAFIKEKKSTKEYEVGDIIAFFRYVEDGSDYKKSPIIFHRIVSITYQLDGTWFYTKGDSNASQDVSPVYEKYVIGEYVAPKTKFLDFVKFVISVKGAVLIVVIPCGLILFKDCWTLINIAFDYNDEKKKKKKRALETGADPSDKDEKDNEEKSNITEKKPAKELQTKKSKSQPKPKAKK